MRSVCCYCKKVMKKHLPGTKEDDGLDSHGICKEYVPLARKNLKTLSQWNKENNEWIKSRKDEEKV